MVLPRTPVPGYCYAVPAVLRAFGVVPSPHSRAGLLMMPSLRDSSHSPWSFPALQCRAIDYAVPTGLLAFGVVLPALPCRAIDYAVPTGLLAFGVGLPLHSRAGLLICRPYGTHSMAICF